MKKIPLYTRAKERISGALSKSRKKNRAGSKGVQAQKKPKPKPDLPYRTAKHTSKIVKMMTLQKGFAKKFLVSERETLAF